VTKPSNSVPDSSGVDAVLPDAGAVGAPLGDGGSGNSDPAQDTLAEKNATRGNMTMTITYGNVSSPLSFAIHGEGNIARWNRTKGALVYQTTVAHIDGTNGMEILGFQPGITDKLMCQNPPWDSDFCNTKMMENGMKSSGHWQSQHVMQYLRHPYKHYHGDVTYFDRDLGFGQWCGTGRYVGTCKGIDTGNGWTTEQSEGCTTLNGMYGSLDRCQALCAENMNCEFMGHRVMMEEEADGAWNGPFHYCEFWTAEAGPGQRTCDQKAVDPFDCCSGNGGRYIVQENNLMMKFKGDLSMFNKVYTSCREAEAATPVGVDQLGEHSGPLDAVAYRYGLKRCDLPEYESWYYSTGNLYRKTAKARFGMSPQKFKGVYREAILIEALKPSYANLMNTTYDRGNHSLILNALGVPYYDPALQQKQDDLNVYYYEFYVDLAARSEVTLESVIDDFAECFMSSCNDDCLRGTNADLRGCTDIIPEMRTSGGNLDSSANADSASTPRLLETASTPRLLGLKQMMRSCWTRGGGMCTAECLAVQNETWTCLENSGSCQRFMNFFTFQLREEEQNCLTDLRTTPTTAVPQLPQLDTEVWKTPVFRRVLLTEGPISAAYLVERMCSTLATEAECLREYICSWQKIRRASSDLYGCAVDDHKVFFNAPSLDEVLSVGEEFKRVCYFHGFDGVCTRECPGSLLGSAPILHAIGTFFFVLSW
jgi:hypothetical protein